MPVPSKIESNKEALTKLCVLIIITTMITAAILAHYIIYPMFFLNQVNPSIKIGVLGPLLTPAGRGMLEGVTLAIETINKRGGVLGRYLEVVPYDDAEAGISKSEKGLAGYIKLSTEDKVSVIIGPYSSHVALALLDLLPKYKTLIVTSGAIADEIDKKIAENPTKYKYFFRTHMNATGEAIILWDYLTDICKSLNITKIAIFYENLAWTQGIIEYSKSKAQELGFNLVFLAPIDPTTKSYISELRTAKDKGAQLIYTLFSLADTTVLIKEWYEQKIPAFITGGDMMAEDPTFWNTTAGKAYSYTIVHWGFRAPITNKTEEFYDDYLERFGHTPNFQSYLAYDAVMIWAQAAETTGKLDSDNVADTLLENIYEGVAGRYKFSTTSHSVYVGKNWKTGIYVQWQDNGEQVPIWSSEFLPPGKSIVLPPWMR